MMDRTLQFELAAGALLTAAGLWLTRSQVADWGLMAIGCLLLVLTATSRAGEWKQLLQRAREERNAAEGGLLNAEPAPDKAGWALKITLKEY